MANCKPGDLAIYVRSMAGNLGRIVTIERRATLSECAEVGFATDQLIWKISETVNSAWGFSVGIAQDCLLRPIRDNPGNESWFQSAPLERAKPAEVEA